MKQPIFTDIISIYRPLIIIVAIIFVASIAITTVDLNNWMINFMGLFFVIFSIFKLLDIKGFAKNFRKYDIIAKKSENYAHIYPYIELGLGLLYLGNKFTTIVNFITFVTMLIGIYSIFKNGKNNSGTKCACLGSIINLPLGKVSMVENITMCLMSFYMLLL